jgi:DNA repair exonuclease SbcCD nuclease subunit
MRFLHTADWQIGMRAAGVGAAGARVREERFAAGQRVVAAARAAEAEFILVAGDTFEDNGVDRTQVQRVIDILAAFDGPVYVIPGNHDPLCPGSVWEHPAWGRAAQVHVLREEAPVPLPGGTLYPCIAREKRAQRDPTLWIPATGGEGIRIGLAHGSVEGIATDDPYYPIPRQAATRCALDYLAIGHWHSWLPFPAPGGAVRMAYAGAHEPTKFGERDSGNALLVTIDAPGTEPQIAPVRTGGLTWCALEESIRDRADLERLRERIDALADPAHTLVSLRLSGILPVDGQPVLEEIEQLLPARFLHGTCDIERLLPAPEDSAWMDTLPPGVLQESARRLQAGAAQDPIAAHALLELYALASERTA